MAAKIIQMALPIRARLDRRHGYTLATPLMVSRFFEYMRGSGGPDVFLIKNYHLGEDNTLIGDEIQKGCIPMESAKKATVMQSQKRLENDLDAFAIEAREHIGKYVAHVYSMRNHGNNLVYVKTRNGIMGSGWYDSAHSKRKGLKLAAMMLYAIGSLSLGFDKTLFEAVYNYLPFDSDLDQTEADRVSDIITNALAELIKTPVN